jgi:methyl-accepting chemotaxis protein
MWLLPIVAATFLGFGLGVTHLLSLGTTAQLEQLQQANYPYLEQVQVVDRSFEVFRSSLQAAALEGSTDSLDVAHAAAQRVAEALKAAGNLPGHKEGARKLDELFSSYRDLALNATQAIIKHEPAPDLLTRMQAAQGLVTNAVKAEDAGVRKQVAEGFAQVASGRERSDWVNVAVVLVAIAALGLAARAVVGSLWLDLGGEPAELRLRVRQIADGDLSTRIAVETGDDSSITAAVAAMTRRLRDTVGQIRTASDSISTGSSEIATGNQDLSTRTELTAANLQQAASELERIASAARHSNDTAHQATQLAQSASTAARSGGSIVASMVDSISGISHASKKITEIIGVIDGIAFQTNILALNAAVEAARAGEQGRGFAVVASEVRALAQRSGQAAREIKGLIQASTEKVDDGTRLAADAGQAINDLVSQVHRVGGMIGDITAALSEQSGSIDQVNRSVAQLEQMTQQNSALVEESAAAASSMQTQAKSLVQSVATFRLEV